MFVRPNIFAAALLSFATCAMGATKINYQDHALPIFRNSCLGCHNPDQKKGGLDLSSWKAAMNGGSDGAVINPGDAEGSLLYRVVTHEDEPNMPPKRDKLPDADLNMIKAWIMAGALPTASGKPAKAAAPVIDLTFKAPAAGQRPAGPPPMPRDLPMEPFVHARRAGALSALASSPWAPLVAVAGQHQVLLYNPETDGLLGVLPFPDGQPQVLRFGAGGNVLLAGGGEGAKSGKVVLWDVVSGNKIADVGEEFDAVLAADITPDQSRVALGGPAKVLKVYSTRDGSLIDAIKTHTDWVTAIAYSPDGVLLASGDRAGGLWVWESKTDREFYNLAGHKAAVTSVAFRPDSNVLASASEDGSIKLWDMNSGKQARTWQAHAGGVLSVAFAADGRIVSCGRDRVVRIWSASGSPLKALDAFDDIALKAVFDYDGNRVVAGDWTGEVRVWNTADGKRTGALDTNPAPVADRIVQLTERLSDLQPKAAKANDQLADARAAHQSADQSLQSARQALAAAKRRADDAQTLIASLEPQEHSAADALAAARELVKSKQAEAERLTDLENKSTAIPNDSQPDEQATTQPAPSKADLANAELADARRALSESEKSHQELADQLQQARTALSAAHGDLPRAQSAILAAQDQFRSSTLHVEMYTSSAASTNSQLADATSELSRLKAAQFFVKVAAARRQLADCQQHQQQLAGDLAAAQANADKANADVAAAEKDLADAPARIQAKQDAINAATAGVASANQKMSDAQAIVATKQDLLHDASIFVQRLHDEAAKAPDDKSLADAAAKGSATLDALNADLAAAQQSVTARMAEMNAANDRVAAAESDLTQTQAQIADAPRMIETLKLAAAAAQGELPAKKVALDQAAQASDAAKSKADQLNGDYQKIKAPEARARG